MQSWSAKLVFKVSASIIKFFHCNRAFNIWYHLQNYYRYFDLDAHCSLLNLSTVFASSPFYVYPKNRKVVTELQFDMVFTIQLWRVASDNNFHDHIPIFFNFSIFNVAKTSQTNFYFRWFVFIYYIYPNTHIKWNVCVLLINGSNYMIFIYIQAGALNFFVNLIRRIFNESATLLQK